MNSGFTGIRVETRRVRILYDSGTAEDAECAEGRGEPPLLSSRAKRGICFGCHPERSEGSAFVRLSWRVRLSDGQQPVTEYTEGTEHTELPSVSFCV